MAGPLFRILANVVVAGASVGVKAFMQAYQQAAAGGGGARKAAQTAVGLSKQIKRAEAREILNVEEEDDYDKIYESYETLMKANDPDQGGSFYLQSKVYRAHEKLKKDFDDTEPDDGDTVIKTDLDSDATAANMDTKAAGGDASAADNNNEKKA